MSNTRDWWRGGVLYQIYPRSYQDSNHDGIGDLPGILRRLPYLAQLGVDAIWLSPFFRSPMKDFGYDVSDYRDVDPMFGTLDDFRQLLARAHELGLKVIIDQVLSHTSDQHPWFQESRQSRENSKADWYVWADPKPDGTPPNNWLAIFGGSAWQFDPRRRQYYLHNFLVSQPDLNFHNPEVRKALLADVRFWLELGVDGFRLDTVNFYFHHPSLQDNPPVPTDEVRTVGAPAINPYTYQLHRYDITQPENLGFLEELRALLEEYPDKTMVGEIGADDTLKVMADYTSGNNKLHMAYTFDLLNTPHSAPYIRDVIARLETQLGDGWPCWALGNHDCPRHITRWGEGEEAESFAKVVMAMLLSMRGTPCLYQGEELGLPEAEVPYEKIQDPYGLPFWPEYKGRDGCRTPMVWEHNQPQGGFSTVEPWLPVDSRHLSLSADQQVNRTGSMYEAYRQFLHWRKQHPSLAKGSLRLLAEGHASVLCWLRETKEERILFACNLTKEPALLTLTEFPNLRPLSGHGFEGATLQGDRLELPPYQAFFAEVD